MHVKYYVIILLLILSVAIGVVSFSLPTPSQQLDLVKINDITGVLSKDFSRLKEKNYSLPGSSDTEYAVIDLSGNVLAVTGEGLALSVNEALKRGNVIADITKNDQLIGRVIFSNESEALWQDNFVVLKVATIATLIATTLVSLVFYLILYRNVLRPFNQMQKFAQRVAAGELDLPLKMQKKNVFGAFTESFDLMRDELKKARDKEYAAERSKRDLVASLSHDIQTPVNSIRNVADLMVVQTNDKLQHHKLEVIQEKTEQIQTLLSDLFESAIEERESLDINVGVVSSTQIMKLIKSSDYQALANLDEIPDCLVQADFLRLAQVFDNVISNSYKYADTAIEVTANISSNKLIIILRDYGPGVRPEELAMISSKYFRGEDVGEKGGYGLGLYIARTLIEGMGGELDCHNADPGFIVEIWLRLDEQHN
jgi:signal transduction histidine kinase